MAPVSSTIQRLPSGPTVMPSGMAVLAVAWGRFCDAKFLVATLNMPTLEAVLPEYQMLRSGPSTIRYGSVAPLVVVASAYSVGAPNPVDHSQGADEAKPGLVRVGTASLNQILPPGPVVIAYGFWPDPSRSGPTFCHRVIAPDGTLLVELLYSVNQMMPSASVPTTISELETRPTKRCRSGPWPGPGESRG